MARRIAARRKPSGSSVAAVCAIHSRARTGGLAPFRFRVDRESSRDSPSREPSGHKIDSESRSTKKAADSFVSSHPADWPAQIVLAFNQGFDRHPVARRQQPHSIGLWLDLASLKQFGHHVGSSPPVRTRCRQENRQCVLARLSLGTYRGDRCRCAGRWLPCTADSTCGT